MTDTVATRYAGTRVPRVEDNRLLTGRGTFVDDVTRPGMLHACFVRSPFARAKINGIDAAAALALPGVRAVFTAGRPQSGRQGGVARRRGQGHPGHPAPAAGRGRGEVRRRPGCPRRRREPLHRRGCRRAGGRRLRSRCRPSPTSLKAVNSDVVVHEAYPDNVAGGMGGAPPDEETFSPPPTSRKRTSTNRSTRRCRWRRAAWSSSGRRRRRS